MELRRLEVVGVEGRRKGWVAGVVGREWRRRVEEGTREVVGLVQGEGWELGVEGCVDPRNEKELPKDCGLWLVREEVE